MRIIIGKRITGRIASCVGNWITNNIAAIPKSPNATAMPISTKPISILSHIILPPF